MPEFIEREATKNSVRKLIFDCRNQNVNPAQINALYYALNLISEEPAANVIEIPDSGIGDLSDGYHTFNELYHHRAVLFSVICNANPDKSWKSKLHNEGDMFDGMFIVGIETPQGQATYHYDIEPYWNMFKVKEFDRAPKWDGHTPQQAIERICNLINSEIIMPPCKLGDTVYFIENEQLRCGEIVQIQQHKESEIIVKNAPIIETYYVNSAVISFPIGCSELTPYNREDFGKTIFLTREEAEKHLGKGE